jgi:DNA-binding MarR family transcriptional regulator
MNPRDLIKFKVMTSGGLTNLLGRMESAGLIARRPSHEDRREVIVSLTDQGMATAEQSLQGNVEQALISALTEEEVQILSIMLRKLLNSLLRPR